MKNVIETALNSELTEDTSAGKSYLQQLKDLATEAATEVVTSGAEILVRASLSTKEAAASVCEEGQQVVTAVADAGQATLETSTCFVSESAGTVMEAASVVANTTSAAIDTASVVIETSGAIIGAAVDVAEIGCHAAELVVEVGVAMASGL